MQVKFVKAPTGGRDHKVGDVVDVPNDYAAKYIGKGWAVEHNDVPKSSPAVGVHDLTVGPTVKHPDKPSPDAAAKAAQQSDKPIWNPPPNPPGTSGRK